MAASTPDEQIAPRTWIGFSAMGLGMFMAILDIQVVATSLPEIREALDIPPEQMSWVQTAYLIAEVISIPLTGWLTRALTMRGLFVVAVLVFTAASIGCAAAEDVAATDRLARRAGVCRRHADPARLRRGLHPVSEAGRAGRDDDRRRPRRAGADPRSARRRLDHADLFLALALPDQRGSRPRRRRSRMAQPSARAPGPDAGAVPRCRFALLRRAVSRLPRDRPQGGAAAGMDVPRMSRALRSLPGGRRDLRAAQPARAAADREPRRPARQAPRRRLRAELSDRRRLVRHRST